MSTDPDHPVPLVRPRPGILKGLGIANIVFAIMNMVCVFSMSFWYIMALAGSAPKAEIKIDVKTANAAPVTPPKAGFEIDVKPANPSPDPGVPASAGFNPLMGMDDKNFARFSLVEGGVGMLISGLMFVTGIGLLNCRRWGANGWYTLAWIRIASILVLWGYYILAVAPGFSEHMARSVVAMFAAQGMQRGRGPTVAELTRVYSIMNLLIAVGAMVFTSIYPVLSLWLLSRPGVKAAIVDKPIVEQE